MNNTDPAVPGHKRRYSPSRPKVPPFARYRGTSVWRKDHRKVRAYAQFIAKSGRKIGPQA